MGHPLRYVLTGHPPKCALTLIPMPPVHARSSGAVLVLGFGPCPRTRSLTAPFHPPLHPTPRSMDCRSCLDGAMSEIRRQRLVRTRARASAMGAPMDIANSQPTDRVPATQNGAGGPPHLLAPLHPHAAPLEQSLRDARLARPHGGRSHSTPHAVPGATTLITLWDFRWARGRDGGALHCEALSGAPPPHEQADR